MHISLGLDGHLQDPGHVLIGDAAASDAALAGVDQGLADEVGGGVGAVRWRR